MKGEHYSRFTDGFFIAGGVVSGAVNFLSDVHTPSRRHQPMHRRSPPAAPSSKRFGSEPNLQEGIQCL